MNPWADRVDSALNLSDGFLLGLRSSLVLDGATLGRLGNGKSSRGSGRSSRSRKDSGYVFRQLDFLVGATVNGATDRPDKADRVELFETVWRQEGVLSLAQQLVLFALLGHPLAQGLVLLVVLGDLAVTVLFLVLHNKENTKQNEYGDMDS